jgi:histidinol-phosphate aminotransferase
MASNIRRQSGLDAVKPYVPGKPIEEVKREYGLTDVVKLASNENPMGSSPKVLAAIAAALPELNYYPDAQNYYLRQGIAASIQVSPDQINVGNGADGIIRETCCAYVEDGDEVVVSRSSFPVYDICVNVMRGKLVKTPLRNYGLDLRAMADAVTDRTRIIFVCNPNNPTGTMSTHAEVDELVRAVPEHVIIVMDEAYFEFADSAEYPDSLRYVREGRPNILVLRTFSKVYGIAGIRLGYGVGQPELLAPLLMAKESFPVNRLAQVAGLAALEDEEFRNRSVALNREGRLYLSDQLGRLGIECVPSHTNFVMARFGPQATEIFGRLLRVGMIVRPCTGYDLPEFLRITIGTAEQNARLIRELEKIL